MNNLTISEQVIFLKYSLPNTPVEDFEEENLSLALIGSILADLFLLKKIELQDNYIVLNKFKETHFVFLDLFLYHLSVQKQKNTILQTLLEFKQDSEKIEKFIILSLLKREVLKEKNEGSIFFKSKKYYNKKEDYLKNLLTTIKSSLAKDQDIDQQTLFLLTILYGINFLQYVFETKNELDNAIKRLEIEIQKNKKLFLLLRDIDNMQKLRELQNSPKKMVNSRMLR